MNNPVNRPSVIVFHNPQPPPPPPPPPQPLIVQNPVINTNSNYDNDDDDIEVVYDSVFDNNRPLNNNNDIFQNGEDSDDFEDYFEDNENNVDSSDNDDEQIGENVPSGAVPVTRFFELEHTGQRPTAVGGFLFLDVETTINPDVYGHANSVDFTETFRLLFQSIFDNVVKKVRAEYGKNTYRYVKMHMKNNGFITPINLQFVGLNDFSSELFLIELYNFIQSCREAILSNQMTLGFTFVKQKINVRK
jgi:hypothetical protein